MSWRLECLLSLVGIGLVLSTTGCVVPKSRLAACQAYNCELQRRNQQVCAQYETLRRQNQELANRTLDSDDLLSNYQKRMSEFQGERDQMQNSYASLLDQGRSNPLPRDVRKKLEYFASRHPEFVEVDPDLGISKFKSDVLFPSGEAVLYPESEAVLREFASIFQEGSGKPLRIMVVGHTDRHPIKKDQTRSLHETNWHLSSHRAIAVEQYLEKAGIRPDRMGVVGYGPYQALDSGNSAGALAKNRRVEIFVLAPDTPVVGRTDFGKQN
jgi:chemotaxis protein MotB